MNKFTPSTHQQRFYDWCGNDQGHAVLNSVAGSGKTTTLLAAANQFANTQRSTIFIAFNNQIVNHARQQLAADPTSRQVTVKTVHSVGFACLVKYFGNKLNRKIDEWKYANLCQRWIANNVKGGALQRQMNSRALTKLVDLTRQTLTDPNQMADLQSLLVRFDVDLPDAYLPVVCEILTQGESLARGGIIDFTDMLYMPMRWQLKPIQYDCVIADEIQDFNRAQLELIARLVAPHGRFIGAGDPRQAIMGFSGADDASFYRVRERFNAEEYALPTCYRCPKSHIALAQRIVPEIQAGPDAEEGVLQYADDDDLLDLVQNGDLILHRKTAPLIKTCIQLIERGFAAKVRGQETAEDLSELAQRVSLLPTFQMLNFLTHLRNYQTERVATLNRLSDDPSAIDNFNDLCSALEACYLRYQSPTVEKLKQEIAKLFSNQLAAVNLSTIHRAKGLESTRVLLLGYDELPMRWESQKPWQLTQEKNLLYVALTRSKYELIIFGTLPLVPVPTETVECDDITTDPAYQQLIRDPLLDTDLRCSLEALTKPDQEKDPVRILVRCLAELNTKNNHLIAENARLLAR